MVASLLPQASLLLLRNYKTATMSTPSITQRKHVRLIPGDPSEPTSTIVLTSLTSHYVDIRIDKAAHQSESQQHLEINSPSILDWAFAGTSTVTQGSGPDKPSHSVWEHWIDSKSDNPASDEGDMYVQENGDVLEKGTQKHPDTGEEVEYEELWTDLVINVIPEEGGRYSTVLKHESEDAKGLFVRVGGWCQGILKEGGKLTVERWRWATQENDEHQGPGYWKRIVRFGDGEMPSPTLYKGIKDSKDTTVVSGELKWEVVENHRW